MAPRSTRRQLALFVVAVFASLAAGAAAGTALTRPGPARTTGRGAAAVSPVHVAPVSPLIVTSAFGRRGFGFHSGVDLQAPLGTPLRAIGPGVVEKVGHGGRGGLRVVLKLDDGWRAGYAHLSRIDVKKGQRVVPGTPVGLSGDTGRAWGPHLHFELRDPRSRRLVDPWPLLRRLRGQRVPDLTIRRPAS